jgi:DNA (cytosine-5)-methyltransferase 1
MKYLSVCSGIEAASKAWEPIGWEPVAFSEIEPFPSAVLKHHWPEVPNLGDMSKYEQWNIQSGSVDLLVGGTPCQSFSVAGLRQGLKDPRGNLMLTYLAIAERLKPRWLVWENVPGVLSSNGGKDFGSFLGALGELGYEWAYRVLDAQWFGVAQRRRRVFVVAHLGKGNFAAKVLFESESVRRDTPPSREARKGIATDAEAGVGVSLPEREVVGCLSDGAHMGGGLNGQDAYSGRIMAVKTEPVIIDRAAFNQGENAQYKPRIEHGETMDSLVARGPHAVAIPIHDQATRHSGKHGDKQDGKGNGLGVGKPGDPCPTLTKGDKHAVLYENHPNDSRVTGPHDVAPSCVSRYGTGGGNVPLVQEAIAFEPGIATREGSDSRFVKELSPTLRKEMGDNQVAVAVDCYNKTIGEKSQSISSSASDINHTGGVINPADRMAVRRLTPRECERLQGFNDDHTMIPWRNKPADQCPDGPRYKALGNSMAVPCMAWIGKRIDAVEKSK